MQTPTERLAIEIEELKARLQIAEEREFFLAAEVAKLNAILGRTDFQIRPTSKP